MHRIENVYSHGGGIAARHGRAKVSTRARFSCVEPQTTIKLRSDCVRDELEEGFPMVARLLLFSAAAAIVLAAARPAEAQYMSGMYQGRSDNPNGPTVSPYLNLLQNNNQLNSQPTYQSLVKPLLDQQSAIQRQGNTLQQLQQQQQQQTGGQRAAGRGQTGHMSYFMNMSHFYSPAKPR
jgi:hypothetical protein